MDFQGQKLSEALCLYIVLIAGVVSFLTGYLRGSFLLMMEIFGGGVGIAALACVPDYPWYNRHPEKWLPLSADREAPKLEPGMLASKKKKERT